MKTLEIGLLRIDGGTLAREAIDQATVDEYAERMSRLVVFPPLIVYHDGESTWLADGFHRYLAAQKSGVRTVVVDWREGTLEMAMLYAAGANAEHGLRRTLGDKRRAIVLVLSTDAGRRWTQKEIAKHCHVAQSYVSMVVAKFRGNSSEKCTQPVKRTKTEQKRTRIAEAAAANPAASDRAIARELGVDRETVAAVRAHGARRPASAR